MDNYLYDTRIKMGESLKEIREKKGYSQENLAEIMKVSRSTISKIENGKFAISIDYLVKFSLHLGFDIKFMEKFE